MNAILPNFTKVIKSYHAYDYVKSINYVFMITNAPYCGRKNRYHVIRINNDTGRAKCFGNELPLKHCKSIIDKHIEDMDSKNPCKRMR